MASVNKVILIGNLTRDPEVRYTPKGTAVGDIALACNRVRTDDSGNRIEEVTYIDVTLWGRQAELAQQYLSKGRPVYLEGRLQMDTWQDKATGQNRSKLKVVAENMQFLGGGQQGGGGGNSNPPQQRQAPPQQQYGGSPQQHSAPPQQQSPPMGGSPAPAFEDDDDDIPF